jgi:hypothetical protein
MEWQAPPLQVLVVRGGPVPALAPRFSANADNAGLQILCFVALSKVLILKGLAKRESWGLFESQAGQIASATDGDGAH